MDTTIRSAALTHLAPKAAADALQHLWGQLRQWLQEAQERRRHERELAQLAQLDPHILRDLGLACEELSSVHAEACGRAERTRRRIASLGALP